MLRCCSDSALARAALVLFGAALVLFGAVLVLCEISGTFKVRLHIGTAENTVIPQLGLGCFRSGMINLQ